jgi:hypothetical protein
MGYRYRRNYRSWRSRGAGWNSGISKYNRLTRLFGDAVGSIRSAFLNLDDEALDELLTDYGIAHGDSAERYARKAYPNWKSGSTGLSGQTMERLVTLVPPYLSPEQRFSLLQLVVKNHKPNAPYKSVRINIKEPSPGFAELDQILSGLAHSNSLSHLPEGVMEAATWLYDDDITAGRAMLAEVDRIENDLIRAKAAREIDLLRKTIGSGQIRSASYSVTLPSGKLSVLAYTPSKCFVATVCCGEHSPTTNTFRRLRDELLLNCDMGFRFVAWYYSNGERIAAYFESSRVLRFVGRATLTLAGWAIDVLIRSRSK